MAHVDPQTGEIVPDENDAQDTSQQDMGGGGGSGADYTPDPAYVSRLLGASHGAANPDVRAADAAGLNYSPGFADPRFHDYAQNLMDQNAMQPQLDRLGAMKTLLEQQFPATPNAIRQKTPPLAYILGGLQDALALGSMLRRPQKHQYYTGRHGRGGQPAMATYYTQPQQIPTRFGGTAAALFGPQIQQQADQRVVDRQNYFRNSQIAAELARYAGSPAMRPPAAPAPPPPNPVLTTYNGLKAIDPKVARTWLENYAAGNKAGAKQTLDEQIQAADASGDAAKKAHLLDLKRQLSEAGRKPGPDAADIADTLAAKQIHAERVGMHRDYVTTLRKRLDDSQAELARLQQADQLAGGNDPALANQIRLKQNYIATLNDQIGRGGYGAGMSMGLASPNGAAVGMPPSAEDMGGGDTGAGDENFTPGADNRDTPMVPRGFDMVLPDGTHFSEWTDADWTKLRVHRPADYNRMMQAIAAPATAGAGQ